MGCIAFQMERWKRMWGDTIALVWEWIISNDGRALGSVVRGEEGRADYRLWMMQHDEQMESCLLMFILWRMGEGLGSWMDGGWIDWREVKLKLRISNGRVCLWFRVHLLTWWFEYVGRKCMRVLLWVVLVLGLNGWWLGSMAWGDARERSDCVDLVGVGVIVRFLGLGVCVVGNGA